MSFGRLAQAGSAEASGLEPGSAEGLELGLGSGAEIGAPVCIGWAGALVYIGSEAGAVWRLAGRLLPRAGTCATRVSPSHSAACPGKPSARISPSPPAFNRPASAQHLGHLSHARVRIVDAYAGTVVVGVPHESVDTSFGRVWILFGSHPLPLSGIWGHLVLMLFFGEPSLVFSCHGVVLCPHLEWGVLEQYCQ